MKARYSKLVVDDSMGAEVFPELGTQLLAHSTAQVRRTAYLRPFTVVAREPSPEASFLIEVRVDAPHSPILQHRLGEGSKQLRGWTHRGVCGVI